MRKTLLLICILWMALNVCAQQKKIDSLHVLLGQRIADSSRLKAWALLAEVYRSNKQDSAVLYAQKILSYPDRSSFNLFKAQAHNSLGYVFYLKAQYQQSIEAFKKYYEYASRNNDKRNMAFAINNEGNVYIELGDYSKALSNYKSALQLRQEINDDYGIAMSYNNIGYIYKDIGDYEKAAANFLFALSQFEKLNNLPAIAITYNYLGAVFARKKDYQQAISYQSKALVLQQKLGDRDGMGISLSGIANVYGEQRQYDKALDHYLQAQELYAANKDQRQLALVKSYIGEIYRQRDMDDKALPYFLESIALNQKIGNRRSLASIWLQAAQSQIRLNQLANAKQLIDSAALATEKTGNKEHLKSLYEVQSQYYAAAGNYQQALHFASEYNHQKDLLLNEANIKSLSDMQVKYETEKKEQQISLLNKDNAIKALEIKNQQLQIQKNLFDLTQNQLALSRADLQLANNKIAMQEQNGIILKQKLDATEKARNILDLKKQTQIQQLEISNRQMALTRRNMIIGFLGALFLLGILLAYSYYRRYRMRQEAKMQAAVLKQQELATKAVLEAEEAERQRIAKDLHDGVGQMMSAAKMNLSAYEHEVDFKTADERLAFEKIIQLVDESCKEVRAVSHNMMPNALLKNSLASAIREFIDKLDHKALKVHLYTEGLDERLDSNTETVLYRVIQECVNNVIKHSGADTLDISVIKENNEITATVEDNGKGFDIGDRQKFDGIGMKNILTRIEYLKGSVDFDSSPGKGTLVAIHVPLNSFSLN